MYRTILATQTDDIQSDIFCLLSCSLYSAVTVSAPPYLAFFSVITWFAFWSWRSSNARLSLTKQKHDFIELLVLQRQSKTFTGSQTLSIDVSRDYDKNRMTVAMLSVRTTLK